MSGGAAGIAQVRGPARLWRAVGPVLSALPLFVVVLAPALASWHGLMAAGRDVLGLTGVWPALVPLTLDAAALYAAVLSLRSVLHGDSALIDRCLVWVYALGSASLNFWYAEHFVGGVPAALFYAAASVSAVVLWDRTLRARRRDALRALGAVEQPTPRFRVLRWLIRPRQTWRAWSLAVAFGMSNPTEALRAACVIDGQLDDLARFDAALIRSPRVALAIPAAELEGLSKAEALRTAWRALGIEGAPGTADVVPAMEWLADRGVVVDRSRAYEVRRRMLSEHAASTHSALSVVGDR